VADGEENGVVAVVVGVKERGKSKKGGVERDELDSSPTTSRGREETHESTG
jgi:hypothetical protein